MRRKGGYSNSMKLMLLMSLMQGVSNCYFRLITLMNFRCCYCCCYTYCYCMMRVMKEKILGGLWNWANWLLLPFVLGWISLQMQVLGAQRGLCLQSWGESFTEEFILEFTLHYFRTWLRCSESMVCLIWLNDEDYHWYWGDWYCSIGVSESSMRVAFAVNEILLDWRWTQFVW